MLSEKVKPPMRLFLRRFLLPLGLSLLPAFATAQVDEAARAEFAAAWAAPTENSSGDSEALRAYPLYPWLAAARLRMALANGAPGAEAAAQQFLEAAGEVAHARDLRRALLTAAASRNDGAMFLAAWRDSVATDTLRCQRFDARRSTGDTATLAQEIADRWLTFVLVCNN